MRERRGSRCSDAFERGIIRASRTWQAGCVGCRQAGRHLRLEVRVGELGGHVEAEALGDLDQPVAQPDDAPPVAVARVVAREQRLERRVDVLLHLLAQHRVPELHRILQQAHVVVVGLADDGEAVGALERADPLGGLPLRVEEERPEGAARDDDAVVGAVRVGGQPERLPLADLDGLAQHVAQRKVLARQDCARGRQFGA
eukprot:2103328-Prymnesium_polylepis.1